MRETTAWIFEAKDYAKALELKTRINGIMIRETPAWAIGPVYVVRPIPLTELQQKWLDERVS